MYISSLYLQSNMAPLPINAKKHLGMGKNISYLHHCPVLKHLTWQRHLLSPSSLTIFSQFQYSLTLKQLSMQQKSYTYIVIVLLSS